MHTDFFGKCMELMGEGGELRGANGGADRKGDGRIDGSGNSGRYTWVGFR